MPYPSGARKWQRGILALTYSNPEGSGAFPTYRLKPKAEAASRMAEPDIAIQHAPIKQAITRRLGIILPITLGDVPIPARDTSRLSRVQVQRENFHSGFF